MAHIDETIATYLSAIETEGKAARTIKSYRESLADFRHIGRRLGFPEAVEQYEVSHVYAFLADVRGRQGRSGRTNGTSPAYQNHHHQVRWVASWSREQIADGRDRNRVAKVRYFGVQTNRDGVGTAQEAGTPSQRRFFWRYLIRWLRM